MNKKLVFVCTLLIGTMLVTGCSAKLKNGEEVAFTVNNKNVTADNLYKELKKKYGSAIMIDMIDKKIFDVVYKDDADIEKQANNQIETLKSQYGDSWETTLKSAGYDSEDDLKDYFILNLQRTKAIEDHIKDSIKDDEIKKYYEENTVGDISAKHILIKVKSSTDTDGLTDDEAKAKAEDLIKKLKDGADFDTLAKENSDDTGSAEKSGDLGYFNKGDMVEEFENAAYKLKVNEYTKTPVKTTYGYHIILKTGEKDKPKLKAVKENIIESIKDQRLKDDPTLEVTTLDEVRKSYGLKFKDSKLKSLYKKYINASIESAKNSSSN